jgi:hypothetical protein
VASTRHLLVEGKAEERRGDVGADTPTGGNGVAAESGEEGRLGGSLSVRRAP